MGRTPHNPAHSLDGGIRSLFHVRRHRPAASDEHRSATNHMHATALSILLLMLCIMMGCTKGNSPPELTRVQGDWQFDEARYVEALRARHKEPAEFKKMLGLYEFAKKNGTPVMTDITIVGSRITTAAGLLRQQYDLSDCRNENGRITAKALWHEDRNDPGDASTIDVVLQSDGTNLLFTLSSEGSGDTYAFRRK
jgi:hypothetical protein